MTFCGVKETPWPTMGNASWGTLQRARSVRLTIGNASEGTLQRERSARAMIGNASWGTLQSDFGEAYNRERSRGNAL